MILEDGVWACKEVDGEWEITEGVVEDEAEMMVELDEVSLEAGGWVRVGEWDGGDEDVVVIGVGGVIEDREGEGLLGKCHWVKNWVLIFCEI